MSVIKWSRRSLTVFCPTSPSNLLDAGNSARKRGDEISGAARPCSHRRFAMESRRTARLPLPLGPRLHRGKCVSERTTHSGSSIIHLSIRYGARSRGQRLLCDRCLTSKAQCHARTKCPGSR